MMQLQQQRSAEQMRIEAVLEGSWKNGRTARGDDSTVLSFLFRKEIL